VPDQPYHEAANICQQLGQNYGKRKRQVEVKRKQSKQQTETKGSKGSKKQKEGEKPKRSKRSKRMS
jgi:hypothetical protein